jgi:hypothetical protein
MEDIMRNIILIVIINLIPVTAFTQSIYQPVAPAEYAQPKNESAQSYYESRIPEKPGEIQSIKSKNKFISKIGLGGGPSFLSKDNKNFNGGGFYIQYILNKRVGFDGYIKGYENGEEFNSEYTDILIVGGSILISTGYGKNGFSTNGFNPYLKAGILHKKVSYFETYDSKIVDKPYRREFAYNVEFGVGIQYMMSWKLLGNIGLSFNLEGTMIIAAPEEIDDDKEGGFSFSFYTMFHF